MSIKAARAHARAARKAASPDQYDLIRKLELAVEELANEIEALKAELDAGKPSGVPPSRSLWAPRIRPREKP